MKLSVRLRGKLRGAIYVATGGGTRGVCCCDGSPFGEPHLHFLTNVCERAARKAT